MAARSAKKTRRPALRRRRSAEEARELILDAAEKRLLAAGPGGIRLQDVAADVGVSHPTILHHFGTRSDLVEAVVTRGLDALQRDVIQVWQKEDFSLPDAGALLRRVRATLGERGHARLLAWLALEGRTQDDSTRMLSVLARALHEKRRLETGTDPPFEDTQFVVLLVSLAMLGEAILGAGAWESAGLAADPAVAERFHAWLVRLVDAHLHAGGRV